MAEKPGNPESSSNNNVPPEVTHTDDLGPGQFALLRTKRFLPLFVTQALGAFNDNAFKNSMMVMITYVLAVEQGLNDTFLLALGTGLFILPFFLFSATAGQVADRYEKSRLIRMIKFAEIVIMGLAAAGILMQNVPWLMGVLFLMGAQSAVFGPLKYSILPQHLREEELIGGNALIEAGTFAAILVGTMTGGMLIVTESGPQIIAAILVGMAVLGYAASWKIPTAEATAPDLKINTNIAAETIRIVKQAGETRAVLLSILGISWFWFMGAVFVTLFPTYARETLHADVAISNLFIAMFSIGIAAGSLLCNRLLRGKVSAKYVPLGALGMTLFCLDLVIASVLWHPAPASGELMSASAFVATGTGLRILIDLVLIAICGGLYSVPLYTIVQARSDASKRSRIIAAMNVFNALFMVVAAGYIAYMGALGAPAHEIFLYTAGANALVAAYICKLLPDEVVKAIGRQILRLLYHVEIKGLENFDKAGDRVVIIANHTSFLDAPVLGAFLPETPTFAINTHIAKKWWVKPAFAMFDLLPLDPTNPMAVKKLIKAAKAGKKCVIFPEGRITVTGALMKVYEGPGSIAIAADATILPVRIDGAQFSPFSRLKGKMRLRWFPRVTITIMEPRKFEIPDDVFGRKKRQYIGQKLYDLMTDMVFETSDTDKTLFRGLLDARLVHGRKTPVIEDINRAPVTYDGLVQKSIGLGRWLKRRSQPGEYIGLLLPNSVAGVAAFFACQATGRVPAMLNFSTGAKNMLAACDAAQLRLILTSRKFVGMGRLEDDIEALSKKAKVVYLEDIAGEITLGDKFAAWAGAIAPGYAYAGLVKHPNPEDAAVVLFTSGSEGVPKGVVLSHRNIQSNRYQLSARVDFNATDTVFNALPIFHSFGLTGGLLLPILSGIKVFLYPSPLHFRIIPELVYDTNATIMFGTDTFLSGYARMAHPYDFYSLRYIFAGAEKVKEETRRTWADKFGKRIFEGYGATETSPVLATNTPMQYQAGSVGRLMPGMDYRLEDVPGVDEGGRLIVNGPNVMKGYLKVDKPGIIQPPEHGWYDTGDIVSVDEDGFVTILGRAKRFAKIAGEMVSLTAVETLIAKLWPDNMHAVVAIPDAKKGEQLVLVTDKADAARGDIQKAVQDEGSSELMIPKTILAVDAVPVLGTGKTDYVGVKALVEKQEAA